MPTPFVLEQVYNASVEHVWHALTDEESIRSWYFPQVKKFKPVVGFLFEFAEDGSAYQKEWRVTRVVDGLVLAHSWDYKGYPGTSEVTFTLCKSADKTRLKLTHTGLETFPDNPHFAKHRFEDGWKNILGHNLKKFLEKLNS